MTGAYIAGIDVRLPARAITNAELATRYPEWRLPLLERTTGVRSRHWADPSETALDLATAAAETLLARCACAPEAIDAILFCTVTPNDAIPPNACRLQARLGCTTATAALDFAHGCAGYLYGLYLARALIVAGSAGAVLLVTADTISKRLGPGDRGAGAVVGDGAAATLVRRAFPGSRGHDLGVVDLGTDGTLGHAVVLPNGGTHGTHGILAERAPSGVAREAGDHLHMDGTAVLAFACSAIPGYVEACLRKWDLRWSDIDLVVFHQASKVIVDALMRALGIPKEKTFSNLASVGNTVGASIPIALWQAEREHVLRDGMRVLLIAFGSGMAWGCCAVTWGAPT